MRDLSTGTLRQAIDCKIKSRRLLRRAEVVDFVVLVGGQQFAPDVVFSAKSYSRNTEWIQVSDTVTANLSPHTTHHTLPRINSSLFYVHRHSQRCNNAVTKQLRYFVSLNSYCSELQDSHIGVASGDAGLQSAAG